MKSVCGHAVADNLRVDASSTLLRAFEFLQDHDARALADHKAIPIPLKRPAGVLWIVVARRERSHRSESRDTHRRNCRFRTAANHHIGVTPLNDFKAIADSVSAG